MRLAVVGTGLIGGSFALAARRAGLFDDIVGIEPDDERGRRAVDLGLVDRLVADVAEDVDAVLLAGPSHSVAPWVTRLAGHRAVLFDVASVKDAVLQQVRSLGPVPASFVPCHPLAGSERSGPEAAQAELFRDADVIVTPGAETDRAALDRVCGWWRGVGARVSTMDPERHDAVLAVTSHLPHLLAFTYLQQVNDEHVRYAAGGFRDFTRIGAADPEMWAPIFEMNRDALLTALDDFEASLARVRQRMMDADDAAIREFIREAAARREGADDA